MGLVADFYVEAMHNGEWVKLADLKDKVQHLVNLRFDSFEKPKSPATAPIKIKSSRPAHVA